MYTGWFAYRALDFRVVAEIQRMVVKQGERNAIHRFFDLRSDKRRLATWRLALDRVLRVFNVRSIGSTYSQLSVCLQTELAIHTHSVVSDLRHDIVNTQNMVSDLQCEICKINATVSDGVTNKHITLTNIHKDILQSVADTQTTISELHRNVARTQNFVTNTQGPMMKNGEGSGIKNSPVNTTRIPPITDCMLIVPYIQARSAISVMSGSLISHLHLVQYLGNPLPRHRELVSDATN